MTYQSFYIFEEKGFRSLSSNNFCHIKKQCTSGFLKAKSFTCQRECLTRKSGTQYIEIIRNLLFGSLFGYITERYFAKVDDICFLSLRIPF